MGHSMVSRAGTQKPGATADRDDVEGLAGKGQSRRVAWKVYIAVALAGMVAQLFVPWMSAKPIIYRVVATASVIVTWVAIRRNRPGDALPWRLLAAGVSMFLIGDFLLYYETIIRNVERAFPGIPDVFYLANFPLVAGGLLLLVRQHEPGGDRASLIDASLIAIAACLVSWVYLIAPSFVRADLPLLDRAVGMAYPLVDVILFALATRLALGTASRRPDHLLVMAGVASLVVADVLFSLQDLLPGSAISTVHFYDVGWMAYYVLIAAAALHPSIRAPATPATLVEPGGGGGRLVVLSAFVLVAPAVLAIQTARRDYRELWVVVLASVALFLLVMVRMSGLMGRLQRLREVEHDHAAEVERLNAQLDSALEASLAEVRRQAEDLQESRARLVAASDSARRQIERNLHDGAQQHLMALTVDLQMARRVVETGPAAALEVLDQLDMTLRAAVRELRVLAQGIFPPLLADRGLGEALSAAADLVRIPVRIEARHLGRYPVEVEAAAYFCCTEALQNAVKHAGADAKATVRVWEDDEHLCFEVVDDGVGFDPAVERRSSGLINVRDRVGAMGGRTEVVSAPGQGTRVSGRIPLTRSM